MIKKLIFWMCMGMSLLTYTIIYYGSFRISNNNLFGFSVLSFYVIIPVVSFICALLLQALNTPLKYAYPFLCALFSIAILVMTKRWGLLKDVCMLCVLPPFVGMIIGKVIVLLRR